MSFVTLDVGILVVILFFGYILKTMGDLQRDARVDMYVNTMKFNSCLEFQLFVCQQAGRVKSWGCFVYHTSPQSFRITFLIRWLNNFGDFY